MSKAKALLKEVRTARPPREARPPRQGLSGEKILQMTPELYKLRRKIIDILYHAKKLLPDMELPRLTVRIVDFDYVDGKAIAGNNKTGVAYLNGQYTFYISKDMESWTDLQLYRTVLHEMAHAWFNQKHVDNNILMSPERPAANDIAQPSMLDKEFVKLARKWQKANKK